MHGTYTAKRRPCCKNSHPLRQVATNTTREHSCSRHILKTLTLAIAVTQFGCGIENGSSQLTSTAIQYDGLTKVSGLAVEAETGQRFVLDSQVGIFLLRADGSTKMLWEKPDELPELTDLCAIGGYRFVVGANGDGYLVDLALGTSRQHFCLEPGWDPGFDGDLRHLNKAVACDVDAQLIYGSRKPCRW